MATGIRNPKWSRDELILALDLYLHYQQKLPAKTSEEISNLSKLLIKLGHQLGRTIGDKYRNPNGVYMKLQNFKRCDPTYANAGKTGLSHGGSHEETIWQEFCVDRRTLRLAATAIRSKIEANE